MLRTLLVVGCIALPVFAVNTTASWEEKRAQLIDDVLGYGVGVLPSKRIPDEVLTWDSDPGMKGLVWNLTTLFPITSTVFYAPIDPKSPSKTAFLFHHGHTDCICQEENGDDVTKYKCRPGCKSGMSPNVGLGYSWWDLYNVTMFFHSIGHDVFILSMPLKGINMGPGSTKTHANEDHWWFLEWEQKGDHALRYFVEPIVLTVNYALETVGYDEVYMAGLSGGGWSTTFGPAVDKRIMRSFPIAGSMPCAMRDPNGKSWPWGDDQEDFEQNCSPNPNPGPHADHPGRKAFQACNYTCQYVLAGLGKDHFQVQILHEYDSCCFAPHNRHDKILDYERNIRLELEGGQDRGWFTATADNHTLHEVCPQDKHIIAAAMKGDWGPRSEQWDRIPCDIIHGPSPEGYTCPEPHPPM